MRVQPFFRNAVAAVELCDATANLRINRFAVLNKPSFLFLSRLQQGKQDFFGASPSRFASSWR
jgi:hypothetical protein